ncbi:MAG: TetR/AcrR family transcriptional regulator [Solirubrobacterales bacterium]
MSDEPGESAAAARLYSAGSDRERLMEAVVRVTAAKGYGATTAAEVCAAAGLPATEFQRHFASKEDCFLAAYGTISDVVVAHVAATFDAAAGEPWPDRVVAALRVLLELLAAETEIARVTIVDVASCGEDARIRHRQALGRFAPFLEQGREYAAGGAELPPDTAQFAIGGAAAMVFDEIRAGRGGELPAILPALAYTVLMPYLGATAEAEMARISQRREA